MNKFLLPTGFRDLLFDEAEKEFFATTSIINDFYKSGYRLVSTPLVEFEDSLFEGSGKALSDKTLKLFDPQSQKVMGIRADITPQISRLVASRLADRPLPLRLCYFGNILRSGAANTRGDRQLRQIGLELIDKTANPKSDAEVINIIANALNNLGLGKLTVDLNTPNLINSICKVDDDLKKAITKRDMAKIPAEIAELVNASGDAEKALKLNRSNLPKAAQEQIAYLEEVYNELKAVKTPASITVDYAENRGFEYQKTISFSIFAKNVRDELGRGGRYEIGNLSATGFTLYINSFLDNVIKS